MVISKMLTWNGSLRAVGILLLAGALGGCQDVLTYAEKSRLEGMRLYNQKAYADAAGAFTNALRQDPREYHSQYYLGLCYDEMGQNHEAIKCYRTALAVMRTTLEGREDMDNLRPKVMDTLARSIARSDQRDVEMDAAEKHAQASRDGEEYVVLARVYRLRGDADSAIRSYNAAALCSPKGKDFEVRKEFGLFLLECNQSQTAEYNLRRAWDIRQDDPEVAAALRRLGVLPAAGQSAAPKASAQD